MAVFPSPFPETLFGSDNMDVPTGIAVRQFASGRTITRRTTRVIQPTMTATWLLTAPQIATLTAFLNTVGGDAFDWNTCTPLRPDAAFDYRASFAGDWRIERVGLVGGEPASRVSASFIFHNGAPT